MARSSDNLKLVSSVLTILGLMLSIVRCQYQSERQAQQQRRLATCSEALQQYHAANSLEDQKNRFITLQSQNCPAHDFDISPDLKLALCDHYSQERSAAATQADEIANLLAETHIIILDCDTLP